MQTVGRIRYGKSKKTEKWRLYAEKQKKMDLYFNVGITVLYQCGGSYGDAGTGSADKGNNRLCEKEGQNVIL